MFYIVNLYCRFSGFSGVFCHKGKKKDGTPFNWFVSLRPERMHLILNLPPTSRVLSSLKQIQATDISGGSKILQQTIGLRPFSFDLEVEANRREAELRKRLEEVLIRGGVGARLNRFFIPKE